MSIEINVNARIVADTIADAKNQMIQLFGVALGKVVLEQTAPAVPERLANLLDAPLASDPLAAAEAVLMRPARTRRTKAQIEADRVAAAAANGGGQAGQHAGAEEGADETETGEEGDGGDDDIDLLGGGDAQTQVIAANDRVISKEEMMETGRKVMDKAGVPGLSAILKAHGFKQIATIPETAYAAVMADLEEALRAKAQS